MPDVEALRSQLAKLEQARFVGARRVRHGHSEVEYRTDAEMRTAILDLQAQIDRAEGVTRPTTFVVRASKGW